MDGGRIRYEFDSIGKRRFFDAIKAKGRMLFCGPEQTP